MKSNYLKSLVRAILTLGVLLIFAIIIRKNYSEIRQYDFSIKINFLIISILLLFLANLLLSVNWYLITRSLKCNLSLCESIRIRLISEVGKYIPGRVLGYGYLLLRYNELGKNKSKVLTSSFYELYLSTFASVQFFTIAMIFADFPLFDKFKFGFIAVSLLSLTLLYPNLFQKIADAVCKLFKKEKVIVFVSFTEAIIIVALYQLFWVIFSIAFYFFIKAFTEAGILNLAYFSGAFAISTFAGFMAFFLPAGIGAREGLLTYLLGFLTGNVLGIVISIGSRLWLITADYILFIVSLVIGIFAKRIYSKALKSG